MYRETNSLTMDFKTEFSGGAHGVMLIIVRNGGSNMSSNPRQGWLHFI